MNELHEQFAAWLAGGARDTLSRDVAVHASACDGCLRLASGFDALVAVDPGVVPLPPLRSPTGTDAPRTGARIARAVAGVAAVTLVATVIAVGANALFPHRGDTTGEIIPPSPGEGVLGGEGTPAALATETPTMVTDTPEPTPSATPEATAAAVAPAQGLPPPPPATPGPVTPPAPSATPQPTPSPPGTPTPAQPQPSESTSPEPPPSIPSESPSASESAEPSPSDS